jgi:DNA-binding NarL/FixJ family response regulator
MPNWPRSDYAFPKRQGSKAGASPDTQRERTTGEAESGRARVLIVEDDFFVCLEIESAMIEAGIEVIGPANTAEEAERYAAEQRPDLVVMDVRLLGSRDGVEAALAIFRSTGIRSIFATAHDDPHTRARAAAAKPLGWIAKPYAMPTLVALVRQALKDVKN